MEDKSELIPSTTKSGLSTENDLPFCGVCSVQFPSKKSFNIHYEQNHLVEKLRCENCYKAFSSKFLFEKHSKKHNCKMKNKMASCEFRDLQISVGNKIIDRKSSTVEKSFECSVCKKSFSSNSNLLNHIQKHNGDKKYVCHICQRKFMKKAYLKRHLRTHTGERPYTCEECFRCFAKRAQLNIHSRIHTGEMPYSCDICSKKFRHVGSLKYHSFFVHNEAGRLQLFSCNVCGTRFKEKRALLRHELRHKTISKPSPSQINNSPVNCVQDDIKRACVSKEELFRFQDNLKPQADIHPEHKPYVCHTCQQCFPNEKSFQEHSDAHTNKVIPVISSSFSYDINSGGENLQLDYHNRAEEKFICNICDDQFDNSDGLKIHFKIHTEQKYFVCEVCQLCFIDEDALRNHQNIEKCVYFHTCKLCGEKFVDKKELEVHCETHEHFANETTFPDSLKKLNHLNQHCTTPFKASVESNVLERSFNDNRIKKDYNYVKNLPSNRESNNKNYTNGNGIKQHNVLFNKKESNICALCLKNFDQKLELEAHICKYEKKSILYEALKSNQVKGYICSLCLKFFIHFHAFQHHMFEHAKQYECKTCGKLFFTADSLEAHCLQSHKPPMHPCIVCKEKFISKNDLIAHCFSHLGAGEYFICALCKQCFKGREDLQKHSPCFTKTGTS